MELKQKAQPFLDALEIASERVRAFINSILIMGIVIPEPILCDVFFCTYGEAAKTRAVQMAYDLRKRGVKAEVDHVGRSMKAQFKFADKIDCKYVVVIGDEELEKGRHLS